MSATASQSLDNRNSLLRSIVTGGLVVGILDAIVWHVIVVSMMAGQPLLGVYQYLASAAIGLGAFEGGIATALLGFFLHLVVSFGVSAVFMLAAERIPLVRRYAIPASLVYGIGVFIVMNMIILPLTPAPDLPAPTMPELVLAILDHMFIVGLPLGIIVWRNSKANQ
jgi:uncharacterized membrane protein YagU involved in acid resistance